MLRKERGIQSCCCSLRDGVQPQNSWDLRRQGIFSSTSSESTNNDAKGVVVDDDDDVVNPQKRRFVVDNRRRRRRQSRPRQKNSPRLDEKTLKRVCCLFTSSALPTKNCLNSFSSYFVPFPPPPPFPDWTEGGRQSKPGFLNLLVWGNKLTNNPLQSGKIFWMAKKVPFCFCFWGTIKK